MAKFLNQVGLKSILSLLKSYIDKLTVHESPDWSESDSNSKSYIKNRTHYIETCEKVYDSISWLNGSIVTLYFQVENYTSEEVAEGLKLTPNVRVVDGESTVDKSFNPIIFKLDSVNQVASPVSELPQIKVSRGLLPVNLLYLYKVDQNAQKLYYRIITEDGIVEREVEIVNNLVTIYTSPFEGEYNTELGFLKYTQVVHKLDKGYLPNEVIIPEGGNAGDVLTKNTDAYGDLKWEPPVQFQNLLLIDFGQSVNKTLKPILSPTSKPVDIDIALPSRYQKDWALASMVKYEVFDSRNNRVEINIGAMFSMDGQKVLRIKAFAFGAEEKQISHIRGALLLAKRTYLETQ